MTDGQFPDTAKQLSSVDRAVTAEDNGSTISTSARLTQVYNTSVADLWEACTTADRLARWFGNVTGDLVLGGEYHIEGNASGTVETCDPPTSFTLTWKFGEEITYLTVRLEEVADEQSESSRRWADAHIAAGASQDAARSAEMRTTAFYLGTEVPES